MNHTHEFISAVSIADGKPATYNYLSGFGCSISEPQIGIPLLIYFDPTVVYPHTLRTSTVKALLHEDGDVLMVTTKNSVYTIKEIDHE